MSEYEKDINESAEALAKYLRQACDAAVANGLNGIRITVPEPFDLPLEEAWQIAERLSPTHRTPSPAALSEEEVDALIGAASALERDIPNNSAGDALRLRDAATLRALLARAAKEKA